MPTDTASWRAAVVLVVLAPLARPRAPRSLRFALNLGRNRGDFIDEVTGSFQLLSLARLSLARPRRAAPDRSITIISDR